MVTIRCHEQQFHNIAAVIFDKDGTVADSAAFLRSLGLKRSRLIDAQIPGVQDPLMMAFGIETQSINPAGLLAVGTRFENEIAAAAYVAETGRDWGEALTLVRQAFAEADQVMQRKADQTPVFEGVLELVRSLLDADLKIGLLSSDSSANVNDFVERHDLQPYFHHAAGIDLPPGKPDPKALFQICEALAVAPAATLVIGDSLADIQMAQAAQAGGCIGVTWGWPRPPALKGASAIAQHPHHIGVS